IAAVTAAELLIGIERADNAQRHTRRESFVKNILARVPVVPFDLPQAQVFAIQFAELARRGEIIGDRDLQIAATALTSGYPLATLNFSEFRRLDSLQLVDVASYVTSSA
ncbi:MAG TPA: PIN domain-containing protein, partial [Nitrospiraceae bacterium]|nr:PIN domain-containing protein [Nitrospiraceae bacterium]